MLVLTRKLMERLYIGDEICVTVVRLEGGQVRLGIEAPRNISVVRAELLPDGGRSILEAAGHREMTATGAVARRRPGISVAETTGRELIGVGTKDGQAGTTPRPVGVPGIGSRLRGPSR